MATNAYAAGGRSGGKIVNKRRRKYSTATPYDRPPPPPPESPNWLTGLVFPATRTIVSGAAKLLSSVFDSDPSSCSSSSSSPPDDDCIDEDGIRDDNDQDKHSDFLKENEGMSKSKHLIEQLLMRETFSRTECDRLINLIKSRVVDLPTPGTAGTLDSCSQAIMEAREWLEDKKYDLHSMAYFSKGNNGSNLTENMGKVDGSPIYVAKSYMKARPPWASPSTEILEMRTPSSSNSKFLDEGTHFPVGDYSMPSSKKKNSFSSGSWNIYEEIRRVRSKATDDMLRTTPSKKIDLPLLEEQKVKQNTVIDHTVLDTLGNRAHDSGYLADFSTNRILALDTDNAQSEIRREAEKSVTVPLNSLALAPQESQDNDQVEVAGECAVSESHAPSGPVPATENIDDRQSKNLTGSKDVSDSVMPQMANGTLHLEDSLRESGGEHPNMQLGKCMFLSEASIEVPNVNEMSSSPKG